MAISTEKKSTVRHNGMIIQFEERSHAYRVYGESDNKLKHKPISVTTLIGKYKKPFDLEGLSAKCAKEEGITQEEMKARWANESRTACRYGTKMHTVAEKIFNGEFVDDSKFDDREKVVCKQINTVVKRMKGKPFDWESEKIIFDPSINVAGTCDLLGKNKETGEYVLIDWKTNKRIRKENEWGETFLSPISELPDCEFSTYALQLTMYEKILKDGGFIPKDATVRKFLCHFHPEDGCHFHEVDAKYVSSMDKMLKDWTDKQVSQNEGIPL